MKQNLYLFSNTIMRRKDNTVLIEASQTSKPIHEADVDEGNPEVLLPASTPEDGGKKKFIPAENIDSIFAFGDTRFNTRFLSFVSKHYIPVHYFNYYGKYVGSFMPKEEISSGNIALKQAEFYFDRRKRTEIAKKFILGASKNAVTNLQYYLYRNAPLDEEIAVIKNLIEGVEIATSVGELMGLEGNVKSTYYRAWQKIFKQDVDFAKRVKRPPDNMINALISYGNVIAYSVCLNEIFRTGLVPSIGYLHSPGDNRFPLSFDIAEIFKPVIVDKTIFKVINLNMIDENDFVRRGDSFLMKDKAKRCFVENLENRLKTTFFHNEMKRHITYKTLIRLECYSLIRHLKDEEEYNPFLSNN